MILHLLTDDKFSDYIIDQFSGPEMCSEFVIMSKTGRSSSTKVRIVNPYRRDALQSVVVSLGDYSAIVFHGLFYPWCETLLKNVPDKVKVAWMFWGGELYGRKELIDSFLELRTRIVYKFREWKKKLNKEEEKHYELPIELFKRIDYCLTDMEEEYEFAKKYLQAPNMKHHWYNYYSIEDTIGSLKDCRCDGDGIFIGNSCTIECNYFDAFYKLRMMPLGDRKVVVPLSYGLPWLRTLVLKYGNRCFGDNFNPLLDFIPREEYNKKMLGCSTMIQPHHRNQAQGNVITGLWLGMRVYISERNFAYPYLKRIGAIVFSIEKDLKKNNPKLFAPLSADEVLHNRAVLKEWYSKDVMRLRNIELVNKLSA